MGYVFAAPGQAVLPVRGSADLYPVRRIYCVGRNYAEHAREMGHSERELPFFFAKPADAAFAVPATGLGRLPYPEQTAELHHEVELVLALGPPAAAAGDPAGWIWGYAVGIDLTRRDLQAQMKRQGRPWEIGKSFDRSAPVSALRPARECAPMQSARIWLDVNGARRQDDDIASMIWSPAEIVGHLSRYFALAPGDLVFTGTPAGVAAIQAGDMLRAGVQGVGELALEVVPG